MKSVPRAADTAYEALRTLILSGTATAGTRLGESELAETLGLSRTPIREALQRLDSDGLVEVLPHRGARVAQWTAADVEEIFELRGVLEPYGAARAAQRGLSPELLDELDGLCDAMEEAAASDDLQRVADCNSRLHAAVLEASGNNRLQELIKSVVHIPLVVGTFRRYDSIALGRSMAHHRELVAALRSRDAEWAESVMRSHTRSAADFLIGHIRSTEETS